MAEKKKGYNASDITVLEGLEAVRKRPGMYIGTTGVDGVYHLINEVFDNSRDEAMGEHAKDIEIALLADGVVRIADNGRGIPVDIHEKTKISALETIMTKLHAGGKFGGEGYKVSGGLHGVGVSVVNALSVFVRAVVHRDGSIYSQEYSIGKPKEKIKTIGKTKRTGTAISFLPDEGVFKGLTFDDNFFSMDRILDYVRDQAYLVKGMYVRVIDARDMKEEDIKSETLFITEQISDCNSYSFYFEGGLKSFIHHHNNNQTTVHSDIFYAEGEAEGVGVEIALQYIDDISPRIFAFGNAIKNPEGGMHVTGFKTALTRSINGYAKTKKIFKDNETFSGEDVLDGLTVVISVKLEEIQFEGQTKQKLGSVEAKSAVENVFGSAFATFLEENPIVAKQIIGKITLAYQARKAAKAAKESVLRKGALEGMTLPGKLADCQVRNPDEAELFIVEGESAGGTAKLGRDRRTQAILPLKGKPLNVEKARLDRALLSEEIKIIIIALGTAIGDTFDIEKLRYGKIIIATDADVDGAHIRTLLLTLFYRHFRPLIENGNIYFAQPPLFKIKKGKEVAYAYSDEEKDKIVNSFAKKAKPDEVEDVIEGDEQPETVKGVFVQRYKGLGEMNHDELRDTTMNPENRILRRVTITDAEKADRTITQLMGSEVPPRRAFLRKNASFANLDI